MAGYVDGFVLPIPKKNTQVYRGIVRKAGKIWMEHGALSYRECIADDAPAGKRTSFPRSVKLKDDEAVWFSWIEFKSRKHRDQVNAKVMQDPRMAKMMSNLQDSPFDGKRMIFGGFKSMVDF